MLTQAHIALVQDSFADVTVIADDAAALFYRRLFEIDPTLLELFRGDMAEQGRKLMQMLSAAVKGLNNIDRLIPMLENLGRRHAGYGVEEHHYDTVGSALLWTLEKGLGAAFTPDVRDAWARVYGVIASTMVGAAKTEAA